MTAEVLDPIMIIPFENNDNFVTVRYRSKNYLWTKEQAFKVLGFFNRLDLVKPSNVD